MSIPADFLDEVRARTDLPALLARSVKLSRAGRDWRACCPFHNEKTPSFYVYADHYHCFGCGAHGDAIRWLTDKQGLPFPDAVKDLAAAAGLEVPQPTRAARDRAERAASLYDVVAEAAQWFEAQLWGPAGAQARAYLTRRGVAPDTARTFGLGFAPEDRTALKRALARNPEPLLVEAGLLITPEDGGLSFDRFRGRLIFPIRDTRGRAVGFGGRALADAKPKYLNSPDTPLFDKGRLLFNLDRAAPAARQVGRLILVEGYMDAIALAEAGVAEAVAPLGTALTEHQLALAWKQVAEPVLCFDGDAAGSAAATKAARRALACLTPGRSVRVAALPAGQDPDDLVRSGGRAALETALAAAEPLHVTLWRAALSEADTTTPEGRAGLKAGLSALTTGIGDPEVRRQYDAQFRSLFWDLFGWKAGRSAMQPPAASAGRLRNALRPTDREAAILLAGILDHPEIAADRPEALAALPLHDTRLKRLRDAVAEAIALRPDLDSVSLGNTLHGQGFAEAAAWLCAVAANAAGAARQRASRQEVCDRLALLVEAPAAVRANQAARASVGQGLKAALVDGDKVADALADTLSALVYGRRDIHDRHMQDAQVAGHDDGGPQAQLSRVNGQDGEGDDGSGGPRGDGERGRRAADRHERRRDQEVDREGEEARLADL